MVLKVNDSKIWDRMRLEETREGMENRNNLNRRHQASTTVKKRPQQGKGISSIKQHYFKKIFLTNSKKNMAM